MALVAYAAPLLLLHGSETVSAQEVASCHVKIQLKAPHKTLIKRLWKQMHWASGLPTCHTHSAEPPERVNSIGNGLFL